METFIYLKSKDIRVTKIFLTLSATYAERKAAVTCPACVGVRVRSTYVDRCPGADKSPLMAEEQPSERLPTDPTCSLLFPWLGMKATVAWAVDIACTDIRGPSAVEPHFAVQQSDIKHCYCWETRAQTV